MRNVAQQRLVAHQEELALCRLCPKMIHPPVLGPPVLSQILQVGQAPGPYEQQIGKPFAWTAGKKLHGWYASLGVPENAARSRISTAAVCRCYPGKTTRGGVRVPDKTEIAACRRWLQAEADILAPGLVIPIGKLAVAQFLPVTRLDDVVGQLHRVDYRGRALDVVPLPHPSGLSTWHKTEPGKSLLRQALTVLGEHPIRRQTFGDLTTS